MSGLAGNIFSQQIQQSMTDILLEDVTAGSVLNADVSDRKGNILLREGMTLSTRHISLLLAQGITHVDIIAGHGGSPHDPPMLSLEQATELIDQRFRNTDAEHPLIQELKRICIQRRQLNPLKGK